MTVADLMEVLDQYDSNAKVVISLGDFSIDLYEENISLTLGRTVVIETQAKFREGGGTNQDIME